MRCWYYYEVYPGAADAIHREKEIKGWARKKKNSLIEKENQNWEFINSEIMEWPPAEDTKNDKTIDKNECFSTRLLTRTDSSCLGMTVRWGELSFSIKEPVISPQWIRHPDEGGIRSK